MIIESVVCVDHLTTASDQHAWHSVQAPSGLRQGLQWLSIIPLMLVAVLVWLSRDVLESQDTIATSDDDRGTPDPPQTPEWMQARHLVIL